MKMVLVSYVFFAGLGLGTGIYGLLTREVTPSVIAVSFASSLMSTLFTLVQIAKH
ncbi:MAG: hypothetical protein WDZ40_02605 [Candidatus Spechtbacterales bacterium]